MSSRLFLPLVIILVFHLVCATSLEIAMHVVSGVPDNPTKLQVHCTSRRSRISDLGLRTLNYGQEFSWNFSYDTDFYICKFYWGSKTDSVDVYGERIQPFCGRVCYLVAKADGFYVGHDKKTWYKIQDWI